MRYFKFSVNNSSQQFSQFQNVKTDCPKSSTFAFFTALAGILLFSRCGSNDPAAIANLPEDSSVSGSAASGAGGALSNSVAGGSLATQSLQRSTYYSSLIIPSAFASIACPTYQTTGSGCTASGDSLFLTYQACSLGHSGASWTGVVALTRNSGSTTCGTFPLPPSSGQLNRQFVQGNSGSASTTPATGIHVSNYGTTTTIDHATANLGNFNGDTISTINNGGYGSKVTFDSSGLRNQISIKQHISSSNFDHSLAGQLSIAETSATTRTISGSITVYHNLLKVVGTTTFQNVVHSNSCCQPISGTLSTVFSAGTVSPTSSGSKYVGKTETLTLTGCGTGSFSDINGNTTQVALSRCF